MARVPAAQRRRQFVDATVEVIAARGVAGATTRRIAEAAGAPLASLHYCFRSKEELFLAVYEEQVSRLRQQVPAVSRRGASLAVAAAEVLDATVEWFRANPTWARAQMELLLWSLRQAEGDLAAHAFELHFRKTESCLQASCARADPAKVAAAARLIAELSDGLVLQWFAFADDDRLTAQKQDACAALRAFLQTRR